MGKSNDTTGLTQVGARYYDQETGSFISPDPLLDPSDPAHANAYAYSAHNPVTSSDPTGLFYKEPNSGGGGGCGMCGQSFQLDFSWLKNIFKSKSKPSTGTHLSRTAASIERGREAAAASRAQAAARAAARAEAAERAAINAAKDRANASRNAARYTKKKPSRDDDSVIVYHYTDKRGFNGIRSTDPYRIRQGDSKNGAGPFFTTRSPADNAAPNAYKKLGITREKSQYVVEFEIDPARLDRLKGDRGDFIFMIRGGVQIPRGDVHYIGPTASWGG